MNTILLDREVGKYPISVATSLALESISNTHDELKYQYPPIQDYDSLWVNIRTLYRNLFGSVKRESVAGIDPTEFAEVLIGEMRDLVQIVKDHSSKSSVVFYVSDYKGMVTKYPYATLRGDKTKNQLQYTSIQNETIKKVLSYCKKEHPDEFDVRIFPLKISAEKQDKMFKVLILTHYPYDLLSRKEFKDLELLESHTGKIKPFNQWYTKYYQGQTLPMLPFREDLLQIFGDKETFVPMPHKLRDEVLNLAKEYRWSAITTRDKIKYCFEKIQSPYDRKILLEILV